MNEPLYWVASEKNTVWASKTIPYTDTETYLDFTSSIFTQNFGHAFPALTKAVQSQLDKCWHAYGFQTKVKDEFEKEIKDFLKYDNALLFSTGAEAIEAAMKICINNFRCCIGIKDAMHGRTIACEALVGKRAPLENVFSVPNFSELYRFNAQKLAIFIEGYRGYDCKTLSNDQVILLKDLQSHGALLVFDEIQSGCYRTDTSFMYKNYGLVPDIVVLGKTIGGGFPLSVVAFNNLSVEGLELTATHSGQPLQMAAGCAVIDEMQNFNIALYTKNCNIMHATFNRIKENLGKDKVNSLGMIAAIQIDENKFFDYCLEHKLLVIKTGKGWIKIAPIVNQSSDDLLQGLAIIESGVKACLDIQD